MPSAIFNKFSMEFITIIMVFTANPPITDIMKIEAYAIVNESNNREAA